VRARVYKVTRTGIHVLKLEEGPLPKIGATLLSENFKAKVLDIIGPVSEPFIVAKPLRETLKEGDVLELKVPKRRR